VPTLEELLDRAREALQRSQGPQAERLARQAVDLTPTRAGAWDVFADALRLQGRLSEAVPTYQQALRLAPMSVEAHLRCAQSLRDSGQAHEALALLRQALRLHPDHSEALLQLGVAQAEDGQLAEALQHFSRAVQMQPGNPQARHNLGVALAHAGRPEEGVAHLQEALRLEPGYAEAGYNLGNVLSGMGRRDEAIAVYRRALVQKPDHHGVLNNLGLLLQEANKPTEAMVLLRQAVRLRPDAPEGHNNLGLALADLGRFDEAERSYEEALRLSPHYAEAHVNLVSTLKETGRHEEALACYDLALRLDPQSRAVRYNRALCLLQMGDWQRGFPEYEHLLGRKGKVERAFPSPRWDGSSLAGKTILVHTEQGLGDTIQFCRYALVLQRLGARVVVECPGYLVPLLAHVKSVDQLVAEGEPLPDFDVHVPLLSVPALVETTPERVPGEVPYLEIEEERIERWRLWLGAGGTFRVGIVWQGNPFFPWDRWRSAPLWHFRALAEVDGVELISLQRTHGLEQLQSLGNRFEVRVPGEELDQNGPFLDTAALLECLDLVVCVDTAVGHLAGALGTPVWLALSGLPDWRWLREREETPWYPSMRLFRQKTIGDWSELFARMASELRQVVESRGRGGLVRVEMAAGEVLDRLTILRIKSQRIKDPVRLAHVQAELRALERACVEQVAMSSEVKELTVRLKEVNERLWDVKDGLREQERRDAFGEVFVELARSVYRLNDQRGELKRRISKALEAPWLDQKQDGGPSSGEEEKPAGS
jgi:tetratricopeptide (TPR) repeat protein